MLTEIEAAALGCVRTAAKANKFYGVERHLLAIIDKLQAELVARDGLCNSYKTDLFKALGRADELEARLAEYEITRSTGKEWLASIAELKAKLVKAEQKAEAEYRRGHNRAWDDCMKFARQETARVKELEAKLAACRGQECKNPDCPDYDGEHPFHFNIGVKLWEKFQAEHLRPALARAEKAESELAESEKEVERLDIALDEEMKARDEGHDFADRTAMRLGCQDEWSSCHDHFARERPRSF